VLLARDLLAAAPAALWGCEDADALVLRIARAAGREASPDEVAEVVRAEAELQATVGGGAPGTQQHARTRSLVEDQLTTQLAAPEQGRRPDPLWVVEARLAQEAVEARDLLFGTGAQLEQARAETDEVRAELEDARRVLGEAQAEIARLRGNPVVRVAAAVQARIRPGAGR
jgi:hypothetical protein